MTIKKTNSGWLVDIQPGDRGAKRFHTTLSTKAEALSWKAWVKTKVIQTPAWQHQKRDNRRLANLVNLWYKHHGSQVRSGKDTHQRLLAMP